MKPDSHSLGQLVKKITMNAANRTNQDTTPMIALFRWRVIISGQNY
ncbi:MAG: hypothetical protein HOP33_16415 [Verrucomicrobia bacterium]|nr:hypothetical protein [Verrucomicrobiota bacterium]